MRIKCSRNWGMYNWALTPIVKVWRNSPTGGGIAIHFLRGYLAFYR